MPTILEEPLGALVDAPADTKVSPEAGALVARMAALAFSVATGSETLDVLRTLAAESPAAFLRAFAELTLNIAPGDATARVALRARLELAGALERTGGLWEADEAQRVLGVKRATLQQWRDSRKVLALPRTGGSYGYPVAQFAAPASDVERPRPYSGMTPVLQAAGDAFTPQELFLLLATPQPALARAGGPARSGFEAIAAGDVDHVVSLMTYLTRPTDTGAPPADTAGH